MQYALSILLSGISLGGQYALIAIGYTMVYGILRLINFAHGDVFMAAGLMMVYLTSFLGGLLPAGLVIPAGLLLSVALTVILGFVIERAAYKPLRSAPRMSVMISAIGVSYLLQNLATYVTGGLPQMYPEIPGLSKTVTIAGVSTKWVTIITPFLVVALVIALTQMINHTKIGMAMRAAAKDFETAQLMGVKLNAVISVTFVIGSFLAAVGSALYFTNYQSIVPPLRRASRTSCFRRGGLRRYRLHPRRGGWGVPDRHQREYHQGFQLERVLRCLYLCPADYYPCGQAYGTLWRKGHR